MKLLCRMQKKKGPAGRQGKPKGRGMKKIIAALTLLAALMGTGALFYACRTMDKAGSAETADAAGEGDSPEEPDAGAGDGQDGGAYIPENLIERWTKQAMGCRCYGCIHEGDAVVYELGLLPDGIYEDYLSLLLEYARLMEGGAETEALLEMLEAMGLTSEEAEGILEKYAAEYGDGASSSGTGSSGTGSGTGDGASSGTGSTALESGDTGTDGTASSASGRTDAISSTSDNSMPASVNTGSVTSIDTANRQSTVTVTMDSAFKVNISKIDDMYVNDEVTITTTGDASQRTLSWQLLKDGEEASWADYTDGSLGNNGGSVSFKEPGEYTLVVTGTDNRGRQCVTQCSFTVANRKPSAPSIYLSVDYEDVENPYTADAKVMLHRTVVLGADPDGDEAALEFAEGSAEPGYYGSGTYTAKARMVDSHGAASGWTEVTLEIDLTASPDVSVTSADLAGGTTVASGKAVTFDIGISSKYRYMLSTADFNNTADRTADGPYEPVTTSASIRKLYADGRHIFVAQVKDIYGNTAYGQQFVAVGDLTDEETEAIDSLYNSFTDEGFYDGDTPIAYVSDFVLSIPEISGHGADVVLDSGELTLNNDYVKIIGTTVDGTEEEILSFSMGDSYAFVDSASGTYKRDWQTEEAGYMGLTPFKGSTIYYYHLPEEHFDWDPERYVKIEFIYYICHEKCMNSAKESLSYTVFHTFIEESGVDWKSLFD